MQLQIIYKSVKSNTKTLSVLLMPASSPKKGGAALRSNDGEGLFYFAALLSAVFTWAACRCKPGCRHQRTGSGR